MSDHIDFKTEDKPLVSVIIPVYKVEKYLDRCVQSIIGQTYRNFEVFLVDDGSPDNCGQICDKYAAEYYCIHVIHQKNAGQGAARNRAAKLAKGEYISFIDSDDYIEPDYLEYLVSLIKKYNADVSIGGFGYLYEGNTPGKRKMENETECELSGEEALIRMNYNKGLGATPWAKLYRKELIIRYPFPEGQIYEDLATLYKIFCDSEKVVLGNRTIYYWVQRVGSTMRMGFDERQMAGIDAVKAQIEYVKEKCPAVLKSARYRYTAKAVELMAVCFNSGGDRDVFQRLRKHMNLYADEVLGDRQAKITMKLRIIGAKLGYYPAKAVFMLHENGKKRRFRN